VLADIVLAMHTNVAALLPGTSACMQSLLAPEMQAHLKELQTNALW